MSKKAAANMGWYINEGIDSFNDDKNRQNLIRKQRLQEKREEKYRTFRSLMESSKSYEKTIVLIRKKLDEERRKNNTITRELYNNIKKKYINNMKKKCDDIKKDNEKKIVLIHKKLDEKRRKSNTLTCELKNMKKKYDVMKKKYDDIKDNEIKSYNKSRDVLCSRQDNICIICDKKMINPSIEHLVPKSKGGSNELYNLAATCTACNNTRGTKPIENIKNLLIERIIEMEEFIKIVKEYIN